MADVRRAVRLGGLWLLAVLAGLGAMWAVATSVHRPAVFLGTGAAVSVGVWTLGSLAGRRPGVAAHAAAAAAGLALAAGTLLPLGDPVVPPAVPPGAGTWTLPDGTTIAYGVVRAPRPLAAPVVVVHGGPGVPDVARTLAAHRPLTEQGRDVWAYAQVGSGRSSRLADPREYTASRWVAELELVRQRIGAPRVVLVGHSYGAYLAARYAAEHPGRVDSLVLTSPGPVDDGLSGAAVQSRLTGAERLRTYRLLARPRALVAYLLTQADPRSARAFAGDAELDARQDRVTAAAAGALHCPGQPARAPAGSGFFAAQVPQSRHAPAPPDIRPALAAAAPPTLIVKGQCDYLGWASAAGYLDPLPDAVVAYVPAAGHEIAEDRPEPYLAAVSAFLAGRPVPGALTAPQQPPAGYQNDPAA